MRPNPADPSLRSVMRAIPSLTDDTPMTTAPERMMRDRTHIALVRTADGAVAGMVALEDVGKMPTEGRPREGRPSRRH